MRACVVKLLEHILPSHRSVSHAEVVGFPLDPVPGVLLTKEDVVVELLEHILPSHRSVSHAEVVGFPLDPVPGVLLTNEGVCSQAS